MDETTTQEPSLQESIQQLLEQVPAPVRDFVLNNLQSKTQELMSRYQIHIDQGGILQSEFLLMLLGQESPAEFVAALQEAGIPAETVSSIAGDINKEVFMKLRESETLSSNNPPLPQSVLSVTPNPQLAVPTPPTPPVVARPAPVVSQAPELPAAEPEARTMASDMALVKSGGFHPQSETASRNQTPVWAPPVVPRAPAPTPVFAPVSTPHPLPEVASAPVHPTPQPTSQPVKAPATPSENRDALHAVLKEYGVDPYREVPE